MEVGDLVLILRHSHGWGGVRAGQTGTIVRIVDGGARLMLEVPSYLGLWNCTPECVEKLE